MTTTNEIQQISMAIIFTWKCSAEGVLMKIITKFTEKHLYQDLCFDNIGGCSTKRIQMGVQLVSLRHFLLYGKQYEKYT